MTKPSVTPQDVVDFWLGLPNKAYFEKNAALDAQLTARFGKVLDAGLAGELAHWCSTPDGALAYVILLDQFCRNIHRGAPAMYAGDKSARETADRLLQDGKVRGWPKARLRWLVLPFMHSEDLADQERCVELCRQFGLKDQVPYAVEHADIIRKFGRFPHRNAILGRASTPEEQAFLADGGFSG